MKRGREQEERQRRKQSVGYGVPKKKLNDARKFECVYPVKGRMKGTA